jgi:hypothetical protein
LIDRSGSPHVMPSFAASLVDDLVVTLLLRAKGGTSGPLKTAEHLWHAFEACEGSLAKGAELA